MAQDVKNRKTSLDEEASIYAKRDEEESEKIKWRKMTGKQKRTHFATYYSKPFIVIFLVLCLAGFFIYKDVITKQDMIYRCAIINERALDGPVTKFGDDFTTYLGLDTDRNLSSFHMYYTNSKIAGEVGATAATDMTQVSSMIYATVLDGMVAGEDDFKTYLENGFFTDMSKILNDKQMEAIKDYLYIPDVPENTEKRAYGVYLDQSDVYKQIFSEGGGVVEKPVFGVIFNSVNKERSEKFLTYVFPQLKELEGTSE